MRPFKYPQPRSLIVYILILFLAGCISKVGDNIKISKDELAKHGSKPKSESITNLEKLMAAAKRNEMPLLAPHHFQEASGLLDGISKSTSYETIDDDITKANLILNNGELVMGIIKKRFAKELELKAGMDKLSTQQVYPWHYKILIYELSRLIEKVELDNEVNIDNDQQVLIGSMQDLYDKTINYVAAH